MAEQRDYPFICDRCMYMPESAFAQFTPTDGWLIAYPEDQLIHIHFGIPTWTEEISTAEAEWTYTEIVNTIYTRHPHTTFFTIVDLTRSDDSEYPSPEALRLYAQTMEHVQTGQLCIYGLSLAMHGILNILTRLSSSSKKTSIVRNYENAQERFRGWRALQE